MAEDERDWLPAEDLIVLVRAAAIVHRLARWRMQSKQQHIHLACALDDGGLLQQLVVAVAKAGVV